MNIKYCPVCKGLLETANEFNMIKCPVLVNAKTEHFYYLKINNMEHLLLSTNKMMFKTWKNPNYTTIAIDGSIHQIYESFMPTVIGTTSEELEQFVRLILAFQ